MRKDEEKHHRPILKFDDETPRAYSIKLCNIYFFYNYKFSRYHLIFKVTFLTYFIRLDTRYKFADTTYCI